MKLHLPFILLTALLGAYVVHGSEIPVGYEEVDLWTEDYLSDYVSNSLEEQYAFILWTDLDFSPVSNPDWTSSSPLVSGGNLMFTTNEGDIPKALSFKNGQSCVFKQPGSLIFDTLSNLSLSNQEASTSGGAVNLASNGQLHIRNVSDGVKDERLADVFFSGNRGAGSSSQYGGAISSTGTTSVINISDNGDVHFLGNSLSSSNYYYTYSYGGAINVAGSASISHNGNISFSANYLSSSYYSYGGAINITGITNITHNGDVSFSENYVSASSDSYGGAIYTTGSLSISNNDDVSFSGNFSSSTYCSYGGAIYNSGSLNVDNNSDVSFSGNFAESTYTSSSSYYPRGGAICTTGSLSISNNGDVTFTGNYGSSSSSSYAPRAGAIYATGSLCIVGNDSLVFENNYVKYGNTYRLCSLYIEPSSNSSHLVLSAKTGGHIIFYDSVYMSNKSGVTVSFNADYSDKEGASQKAEGDIIFTGQFTTEHLKEIKGGTAGTASEITNSQTSEILNLITLYGGALHVVDGAKLNGRGLVLAEGSNAKLLLRDGSMSHSSYNFTFNGGTTLELQGYNTITASRITMGSGSTLTLAVGEGNLSKAALNLGGTDLYTSQLTINLERTDGLRSGMYKIISQNSTYDFTTKSAWTAANVTINGRGYADRAEFVDLVWENGTLCYKVGKNTWSNASGNCRWNVTADNWTMNERSYTYLDGMDVCFSDNGAGEVVLEGELAPASIEVNNSAGYDYTFMAADSSSRLTGATTITKSGAGELTIAMANEHTGSTDLKGGVINVHHSAALGATAEGDATLSSASGTTLRVGNKSYLVLAGNNSMAGAVEVENGATLEMKGNGYAASASTVNGTLTFTGSAAATSNAGSLSGAGTVKVVDSQVRFESSTFTGNLEVRGKDASLNLTSGKYTGSGQISLKGGTLTFGESSNLTLNSGGALDMSADIDTPAELSLNNLNVKKGATLMTHAEVESALSLKIDDVVGYGGVIANESVGGVLDCARVTLNAGSSLVMDKAHFGMAGGALTLAITASATEKIELALSLDDVYTKEMQVVLFSDLGTVNFIYDKITATSTNAGIYTVKASNYFINARISEDSTLVYDCSQKVLYLTNIIPEPATATLSLLALSALAARRRRR